MTELIISFTVDGIHFWPNAPEQYEEFSHPHRHLFKFICWYPQKDSQDPTRRKTELWKLRQDTIYKIFKLWNNGNAERWAEEAEPSAFSKINFGPASCEGIAQTIKDKLGFSKVFCGEDDFFGAIVS